MTTSVTAQTIINGALRLLQVASTDVTITADESNDAFEALNKGDALTNVGTSKSNIPVMVS